MFSIITTTYHGNQYLNKLFSMIESNTLTLQQVYPEMQVEYVLINDSPWEPLVLPEKEGLHFTYRILENPENYGIHKSRIRGITAATGELITILDQDDEVSNDYLLSQYQALGNGNAVVCNGLKEFGTEAKIIYRNKLKMSLVNRKLFYLKAANQIVSPGQCLLRKSAIPQSWLDNPQKVNGSDDLFLWLLMLEEGIRFTLNPEKLYIHKQVGDNLSNSLKKMYNSDMEMCALLRQKNLIPEKDIAKRERMCAYLKASGYKRIGSIGPCLKYLDIFLLKVFAFLC